MDRHHVKDKYYYIINHLQKIQTRLSFGLGSIYISFGLHNNNIYGMAIPDTILMSGLFVCIEGNVTAHKRQSD